MDLMIVQRENYCVQNNCLECNLQFRRSVYLCWLSTEGALHACMRVCVRWATCGPAWLCSVAVGKEMLIFGLRDDPLTTLGLFHHVQTLNHIMEEGEADMRQTDLLQYLKE